MRALSTVRRAASSRPPPDEASLRQAALAHLAKFAATEAGLARVLERRIDRWARTAEAERQSIELATLAAREAIPPIVKQLAESGVLSDTMFAQTRARALARSGRSKRAIGHHLASKGVPAEMAHSALPENSDHELAAALIHARKRRLGPWRKIAPSADVLRRELGSLARAGFAQGVASRALRYAVDEAEAVIAAFRASV